LDVASYLLRKVLTVDANYSFGAWLRNFRDQRHLTQEELAEQLGFSPEYIRKLESNRRPLTRGVANSLADFLDLKGSEREKFIEDLCKRYLSPEEHESEDGKETEGPAPGDPPYKGLNFFEETDAHLYFGCKVLTTDLINRLTTVHKTNSRFLAVIGASGSGKSSLVRAGLVPALKKGAIDGSDHWLITIVTPTAHPLKELAAMLTAGESDRVTLQLMDDLTADARTLDLHVSKVLTKASGKSSRFLLIVDQFEELFTLCKNPEERSQYIDNLLTAAQVEGPTTVVLTLRADFYRHCLEYEPLRLLLERHTKTIGGMNREELREAIVGPAAVNGWDFEAGLVDIILKDVEDEPGALPLLSHALRESWERRRGRTLTLAGYSKIGRVQGAIATTADRVFAGLNAEQQMIAKRIFLRLTELGEGAEDTRRRVSLAELLPAGEVCQNVEQMLKLLADARLITLHRDEAEVAHEALIREWPLLRGWLANNRTGLHIHRRLTESAHEWKSSGFDSGILYRGSRLEQASAWAQEYPDEPNDLERQFLAESWSAVERQKKAEEETQIRELEHQRLLTEEETKRAKLAEARAKEAEEHAKELKIASIQLRRRRHFLVATSMIALLLAAMASWFGTQAERNASHVNTQRLTAVAAQATTTVALATADADRANAITQRSTAQARATVAVVAQTTAESSARTANAGRLAIQARILSASTDRNQLDLALLFASQAVTMTLYRDGYVLPDAELALVDVIDAVHRQHWHKALALAHPDKVFSAAYSPDGQLLVSASADQRVRIWNLATGQEVRQLTGHRGRVWSAVFSPNGQQIASASEDGTIRIWDVASGREIHQLTGHAGSVTSVAFHPDGQQIVSASEDQTVRLWDVASEQEVRQWTGHESSVWSVAFSPDGQQIISASDDQTVRIWDVASSKQLRQLVGHIDEVGTAAFSARAAVASIAPPSSHTGGVRSVAFSLDGQQIVSAGEDSRARIWNVATGAEIHILYGQANIMAARFSPDGQQIVGAIVDGMVRVWDRSSEREMQQLSGHTARAWSAVFSPDGQQIASASEDGTVIIWRKTDNASVHQLRGHTASVRRAAFSPNGEWIISASEDTTIHLWEVKSGKQVRHFVGHADSVRSALFSPNGQLIVSASEDGTMRIWDVASGKEVRQLLGHNGAVWSAVFSPDGQLIASAGEDATIRIWDVGSGEQVRQLLGHEPEIWSVAFSPDGKQLASGSEDNTVRIWEVATGQEVHKLPGDMYGVWSVAFSPDGQQLVSAGEAGTIRIWDVVSGQEVRQLVGHVDGVRSAAFSPDGRQIVSASADQTVRIWEVASGKQVRQLVGHTERVLSVVYSPDGHQIASSSADTTIRLWQASIDELLAQAQALIQRDPPVLTPEERQQYGLE
jgi:WD40 repeat protein/transcriptional regulator with XRE-family HTH domain/energy-coupling factor transporter ATP-binding protein EcfA2